MPFDVLFLSWADFGLFLGAFGQPLDHFGTPWNAMEVALVRLGTFSSFLTKLDVQFRANGSQVRNLRTKSDLAELGAGSR